MRDSIRNVATSWDRRDSEGQSAAIGDSERQPATIWDIERHAATLWKQRERDTQQPWETVRDMICLPSKVAIIIHFSLFQSHFEGSLWKQRRLWDCLHLDRQWGHARRGHPCRTDGAWHVWGGWSFNQSLYACMCHCYTFCSQLIRTLSYVKALNQKTSSG